VISKVTVSPFGVKRKWFYLYVYKKLKKFKPMDEATGFCEFRIRTVDVFVQSQRKSVALSHPKVCTQLERKFKL
jgi:hypothetical protein